MYTWRRADSRFFLSMELDVIIMNLDDYLGVISEFAL